ncbi:MAG: hypothetical protein BWX71_02354 [Deltaproteobacteria bacterium ADurb.Bin072]|nr:MAG: hypothetical protein BWX71_02354 [Deltaproteobacteria bacterium ADurb.Bin072]
MENVSLASRFSAASGETMAANPKKPTRAMMKPTGMREKRRTTRAARPMRPIVVGVIRSPLLSAA